MAGRRLDREKLFEQIVAALREMPEPLAQAFILSHYQGRSCAEIAEELGVSEKDIAGLLKQANHLFYQGIGSS